MINEECWTDKRLFKKFTYKLIKYQHKSDKLRLRYILIIVVLNSHYIMFPRHETALIHYTGRAVINLGLDFTSRDSVDSYCPEGCATCPVRLFFSHDMMYWLSHSGYMFEIK